MDDATKQKIVELLESGQEEMCNLALAMFTGLTRSYGDYFDVRMMYDPKHINIEDPVARAALNRMFNHLDRNTMTLADYKKHLAHYRRTSLTSKQKRQAKKRNFNRENN